MPNFQTVHDDSAFQKTTATVLPDNSTGAIDAQDVRDMYATLRDHDQVKLIAYSSTASLTIDLSAGPVQRIVLKSNIGSVSFANTPPVNLIWPSEDITHANWTVATSTTVSAANVLGAFDTSTADRLTMGATTNTSLFYGFLAEVGVPYRFGFYAKLAGAAGDFDYGFANSTSGNLNEWDVDTSATGTWGLVETTWTADATATRYAGIDNRLNTLALDIYVDRFYLYCADAKPDYVRTTTTGERGEVAQVELLLQQDGTGGRTVAWGSRVRWENSATPTLSTTAHTVDRVMLESVNGGATWFATLSGQGFGRP